MIKILPEKKDQCCGCSACVQVCPKQCIRMSSDSEGFRYPEVDEAACIQCGACDRICPVQKQWNAEDRPEVFSMPFVLGGFAKDSSIRGESSSGGIFSVLAEKTLLEQGCVFGCALDEQLRAVHIEASNAEELAELRKSKYVQSDITGIYAKVRERLQEGRKVLFVGTPCQAAGLASYLGRKYDSLLICDFICHGVPSPLVFQKYIQSLEEKYGSRVESFHFRNKDKGWNQSGLQMGTLIVFADGRRVRKAPALTDPYMNGFLDNLYLRPICYDCPFKALPKSYADLTIADFWGVNRVDKSFNDGKGLSLVLVHSQAGKTFLDSVREKVSLREYAFNSALQKNPTLTHSAGRNPNREHFFRDMESLEWPKLERKYLRPSIWIAHKTRDILWKMVQNLVRGLLQPVLKMTHREFSEKQWETLFQFIKFGMVGVSNSIVSYLINISVLFLLSGCRFKYDYVIANTTAFLLSVLWSFFWNNRYVFTVKDGEVRSKGKTLLKTYLSYGFSGIILNNLLSTVWIQVLGLPKLIAPLLNLPFTIPTNFLLNKLWAYRVTDQKQ